MVTVPKCAVSGSLVTHCRRLQPTPRLSCTMPTWLSHISSTLPRLRTFSYTVGNIRRRLSAKSSVDAQRRKGYGNRPVSLASNHRVENDEKFTHACSERLLCRFA